MTYDAAGNITSDPRFRNLTYGNEANGRQNFAAAANGSGPVTAVFDGAGQRVANKAGGVLTIMVYDAAGKLVAEYGATAPTTANLQYVTADYQGSTRVVTNSSGAVANRRDYLPFGEEIGATVGSRTPGKGFGSGDMVRQKYAGMESDDATGMAHTLWRKQDNFSGRWTSPDPYGGSMTIAVPQSFNRYIYCENDPVNLVDPTGLALSDIGVYQTDNPAVARELENEMVQRFQTITSPRSTGAAGTTLHESMHHVLAASQSSAVAHENAGHSAQQKQTQQSQNETGTEVHGTRTNAFNCAASSFGIRNQWIQAGGDMGTPGRGVTVFENSGEENEKQTTKSGTESFWVTAGSLPLFYGGTKTSETATHPADRYMVVVFEDKKNAENWHVMHQDPETKTWVSKNGRGPEYVGITNPRAFYNKHFGNPTEVRVTYYFVPLKLLSTGNK